MNIYGIKLISEKRAAFVPERKKYLHEIIDDIFYWVGTILCVVGFAFGIWLMGSPL